MDNKSSETKSPLKDPPLRLAGQSLDEEIERLIGEDAAPYLAAAIFATLMAANEWWRWYFEKPPHPVGLTLLAIGMIAYTTVKLIRVRRKVRSLRQGRDGERAVGQFLETLREDGFRIFHDLPGKGFNVDHVVIGPQGVFTVETKTISKPAHGDAKIVFDGKQILVNGRALDRDPITQAHAQADWLRNLIAESAGRKFSVRSVVLFPGWWVDRSPEGVKSDVWVLNPKALPAFLAQGRETLTPEDVSLVSYHISRYVRAQSGADS